MTKRELRQAMREQKKALRKSVAQLRVQARAQFAANPAVARARKQRRIRRLSALVFVLLLLLFIRCECEAPPEELPVVAAPAPEKKEPPKVVPAPLKPKPAPVTGKVKTQPRASYETEARAPPAWLEEFRLQVSARSPRLAQCFTGSERPGGLRWSAAVNAGSGAVSDHQIEPLGEGASMTNDQRDCVLAALSKPRYLITTWETEAQALPSRVSIVIEF